MWQALRSDLKEFVAVVTDPNASKDGEEEYDDISPAQEEALRRMALDETYTFPLLDDDGQEIAPAEDVSPDGTEADDLAAGREQIQAYIDSFTLEAYEEEIAKALETHGEVLQPILQRLVPETVTRKDFWMRYFYICSEDRIQQEIVEQENRERLERVSQSIQGVKSFLGGAVMSVASSIMEDDEGGIPAISPFHMSSSGNRRPPFVMNTAVDEDDDAENELGWSDDEADESEEEEAEAQIEFKDPAMEQLQEELKQALEERDMLHQTVELQQKQLAELNSVHRDEDQSLVAGDVEKLKLLLFEKESELAALRSKEEHGSVHSESKSSTMQAELVEALQTENAQLNAALMDLESRASAAADDRVAALEQENIRLKSELELKEAKLAEVVEASGPATDVAQTMLGLEQANMVLRVSLESKESEYAAMLQSMQSELAGLRQSFGVLEAEKAALNASLSDSEKELATMRGAFETDLADKDNKMRLLADENSQLKAEVDSAFSENTSLRQQMESLSKQLDSACGESAASPESVVKVDVVVDDAHIPLAAEKNDDGSDDWGEDWGDDDE